MKKVLIDCDPGMDDSVALIMALKSPDLDVQTITTVNGNYPVDITSKNALKITEMLKKTNIPVSRGQASPLIRQIPKDPFTHGTDGQGENHLPEPSTPLASKDAVDSIISTIKKHPHEITILALAPLTNIALAIIKAPEIIPLIHEIIAISGSFGLNDYAFLNATGDTPQSEWNVYVDPEASKLVYESGIPFTAIGLDVATHFDVDFSPEDLSDFENSPRKEAQFLRQAIRFTHNRGFAAYCTVIDCMAVGYAIDPTILSTFSGHVGIETQGILTLGMTVLDRRHHHTWNKLPVVQIAYKADYRRFLQLVKKLILA